MDPGPRQLPIVESTFAYPAMPALFAVSGEPAVHPPPSLDHKGLDALLIAISSTAAFSLTPAGRFHPCHRRVLYLEDGAGLRHCISRLARAVAGAI